MYCNRCGKRNSRGSRFCRHCGASLEVPGNSTPVPDEEYAVKTDADPGHRDRVQRLLDRAFTLSEQGDIASAVVACQQAIVLDPTSASAHSFLALLYERSGQKAKAVEEYERVLFLNPESTLDRESLDRLQRTSRTPRQAPSEPMPPVPLRRTSPYLETTPVVATATLAIILLLGIHYIVGRSRTNTITEAATENTNLTTINRPLGTMGSPQYGLRQTPPQSGLYTMNPLNPPGTQGIPMPYGASPQTQMPPQANSKQTPRNQTGVATRVTEPLPSVDSGQWMTFPMRGRMQDSVPATQGSPFGSSPSLSSGTGSTPTGAITRAADSMPAQPPPPTAAPGNPGRFTQPDSYIRVNVAKSPGRTTQSQSSGAGIEPEQSASHEQIGNQLFLRGDWDGAIENYRRALDSASFQNAGILHQQLAYSYLRKKETAQAVNEYRKAITAYRQQLNAGIRPREAEEGIRTCQQAIDTWEPLLK